MSLISIPEPELVNPDEYSMIPMMLAHPPYINQLNDITFWYPILKRIRMRTPQTKLFYVDEEAIADIMDGKVSASLRELASEISKVRDGFGGTAFLRTGQTSNKHEWEKTCFLTKKSDVIDHLGNLILFSGFVDLPFNTFAVREMIDTAPLTVAFDGDMPIAREVRVFAKEGEFICAHPYWPSEAFDGQNVSEEQLASLHEMPDLEDLKKMAIYVSKSFRNAWSMDFLQDKSGGWWLTDMALMNTSYHWPDCEFNHE